MTLRTFTVVIVSISRRSPTLPHYLGQALEPLRADGSRLTRLLGQALPRFPRLARFPRITSFKPLIDMAAEVTVDFDASTQTLSALNAAVYRLVGTAACAIDQSGGRYFL